jgi:hypothetical protein
MALVVFCFGFVELERMKQRPSYHNSFASYLVHINNPDIKEQDAQRGNKQGIT